jgi:hypothetical protein
VTAGIPQQGDLAPGFFVEPGRCWRMVYNATIQGDHCANPVVWRGRFANAGKHWDVWACDRHLDELENVRAIRHE